MKKNKNVKILLPFVIVIWSILIYKIYDAFRPNDKNIRTSTPETFTPTPLIEKDTFSLLPVDKDPFLGTLYVKKDERASKPSMSNKKKEDGIVWPAIEYRGIVSDQEVRTSVFILQINGRQHLVKKGETIQDVQLVSGSNNAVQLRYKGLNKNFSIM